jgi:hypothetical protein
MLQAEEVISMVQVVKLRGTLSCARIDNLI